MSLNPALFPITAANLQGLIRLLKDDTVPLKPLDIAYQDYRIVHPGGNGPELLRRFIWLKDGVEELLNLKLRTWNTRKGAEEADSYLIIRHQKRKELVGFSLGQLLQDESSIYPGFRLGNGEGGKNRWFGRSANDARSEDEMKQLNLRLRSAWQQDGGELVTHPELQCAWLQLAAIPTASVQAEADDPTREAGKNIAVEQFLKAFLIAEKMRDDSRRTAITPAKLPSMSYPLNQILYGPPGTGKTYATTEKAYEIMEGHAAPSYAEARRVYQQRQYDQVEFITFHQSFTYEDFIQGLRPTVSDKGQMVFKRHNGIFYELAQRARKNWERSQPLALGASSAAAPFEEAFNSFIQPLADEEHPLTIGMHKAGYSFTLTQLNQDNLWFKKNGKAGGIAPKQVLDTTFKGVKLGDKGGHSLNLATLQQLYEQGPDSVPMGGLMSYYKPLAEVLLAHAGVLPQADNPEPLKRYVLIIDEINRANISKVFGELLTLLEPDKRLGAPHALTVRLPSGDPSFGVPPNLYVIGTMNTADRSVALLDIALRRRFEFEPLYPLYKLHGQSYPHAEVLQRLNVQITLAKSRDFQIGHAYFMGMEPLSVIMNRKVIPLLYEYFLNDEKKIKTLLSAAQIPYDADIHTGLICYQAQGAPLDTAVPTIPLTDLAHAN